MDDLVIGPFHINFRADGVTFLASNASNILHAHALTYSECYQLLAELYQRRDELYKLSHGKDQRAEGPPTYTYNEVTYVINDESISVSGWERVKEEERKKDKGKEEAPG